MQLSRSARARRGAGCPGDLRVSLFVLLLAALFTLLPAGAAAQTLGAGGDRPRARGGVGPVVELPASWRLEPARLYRREMLLGIQVEMVGLEIPGMPPMNTVLRQEVTIRTSLPDEAGNLYAQIAAGEAEVLEGPPDLGKELAGSGAGTVHVRVTSQGEWEILGMEDGKGEPMPLQGEELGNLTFLLGAIWPEAPRVGSTWELSLEQVVGLAAAEESGVPPVTLTATLESVEGRGADQVALIRFALAESPMDVRLGEAGTAQTWVEADGQAQVRVRDGLSLAFHMEVASRTRMPGGPSLGAGATEMLIRIRVDERALGEEERTDPPTRPW